MQPVASDPRLAAALSDATAGSGSWEPGWTVDRHDGDGAIVATPRLRVRVSAAECRAEDGGPIRPAVAVSVRLPKELPALSPGFFMVLGAAEFDGAHIRCHSARLLAHNGCGGTGLGARA